MNKKVLILGLITIFIPVLIFIVLTNQPASNQTQIWVEIDPIQCMENSWEIEWLEDNPEKYPSDYPRFKESLDEIESKIIIDYYNSKNLIILDLEGKNTREVVCEACSCKDHHTIYALIGSKDLSKFKMEGFTESNGP